jgi:hypothetical protein
MYPVAMVNPVPNETLREFIVYVLGTGVQTTPFLADCFRLTEWWATSPKWNHGCHLKTISACSFQN